MHPTARKKRPAPWDEERTLPPRKRGPMPRVAVNQNAPPAMPPTPELSPSQRVSGGFSDRSLRDLANAQLRKTLSAKTQEEAVELLMAIANRDIGMRLAIESENRRMFEASEEKHGKAEKKKGSTSLNFDRLLRHVEDDLYMQAPPTWSWDREMDEACRVTDGIDKIFAQLVEYCAEDSPSEVKCGAMVTARTIWDIVIFAPSSLTRKQCLRHSVMWEKPTLTIWHRMNQVERKAFASHSGVVESLVETAIEWKNHCQREDMFGRWLLEMNTAADGAMSAGYAKWDAQNGPRTPQSQGADAAPSSPPIVNLTLD